MMVEQMVNSKFSKYGLGKCASILSSSDKQPLIAIKNTTLRDVQSDNKNGLPRPFGNLGPQRKAEPTEAHNNLLSPTRLKASGGTNVNQHLVYARRKSDAELNNSHNSEKNQSADYQPSQVNTKQPNSDGVSSFEPIPVNSNATSHGNGALLADSVNRRDNGQSTVIVNSVPCTNDSQVMGDPHWRVGFIQLQKYLKQCDSTNQEAYVKKLRSFTADECSRHAVELERRAIHLMLEEGKEIQRMKELNILGKSNYSHSPQTPSFKSEKL